MRRATSGIKSVTVTSDGGATPPQQSGLHRTASSFRPTTTGASVATPADLAIAAGLPPTTCETLPKVSLGLIELLRDPELVASLLANAAAIEGEGDGTVSDILARIPGFLERYEAHARLTASAARVRDSLARDNADFLRFINAAVRVCEDAGELDPMGLSYALGSRCAK